MAWISPTGFNDPSSKYTNEANAYDENVSTAATCSKSGYYLELTHAVMSCDKVRIQCYDHKTFGYDADIDIDVYYSGGWHNIWSGIVAYSTWVEKEIGSIQSITAARIKCNFLAGGHIFKLCEFDFNEVAEEGLINGYFMQNGSKEEKFGYYMNSMEEFGYYMNS